MPLAGGLLRIAAAKVVGQVLDRTLEATRDASDSRPIHDQLFESLTPTGHPYYAGNYRGAPEYPCLRVYGVGISTDRMVGTAPQSVRGEMAGLADALQRAIAALDAAEHAKEGRRRPEHERLVNIVAVAARFFHEFLTIHPYANGNGHVARFLVWILLVRYGHVPTAWTIEPRPAAETYSGAIADARRGRPQDLERLIFQAII